MTTRAWITAALPLCVLIGACGAGESPAGAEPDAGAADAQGAIDAAPRGAGCIAELAIGGHHSCALRTDGALFCWGANNTAQLNDESEVESPIPRRVLDEVVQVEAGYQHTCAIDRAGALACWGRNSYGQVGVDTGGRSTTARAIELADIVELALDPSSEHTCARVGDGGVWCWGANERGQVGNGGMTDATSPARVAGEGLGLPALAGFYSCALSPSDGVSCWGWNTFGGMGISSEGGPTPRPAVEGHAFVALSAAGSTTCGVKADGSAWCWGDGAQGQLGVGGLQSIEPIELLPDGVERVIVAGNYVCALRDDRSLWCWGKNSFGQLAVGTTDDVTGPTRTLLADVVDVSLGISHACALTGDGVVSCWGFDRYGQLGRGALPAELFAPHPTPAPVAVPCE